MSVRVSCHIKLKVLPSENVRQDVIILDSNRCNGKLMLISEYNYIIYFLMIHHMSQCLLPHQTKTFRSKTLDKTLSLSYMVSARQRHMQWKANVGIRMKLCHIDYARLIVKLP